MKQWAMIKGKTIIVVLLAFLSVPVIADGEISYLPARVVYDVSSPDPAVLQRTLDRAALLQDIYGNDPIEASIVIVLHEGAIPLFSNKHPGKHHELIDRARGLTLGDVVRFRICRASARMQGYGDGDFHDFIAMVPMADAEIVRLQGAGYAYIR